MRLEKLQAERDRTKLAELPISYQDLCRRYEALYTGAINDVLREHLLLDQAFPPAIMPLRDDMIVAGIAFTIRSAADPTIAGEMDSRVQMLDALHEYAICVWDTGGEGEAAHWGEVMTASARVRGARGAVIDGGIRDTRQVLAQDFPIFYRYRTSNGSLGRCKITAHQVSVKIGRVIVHPGDIVLGDIDGVVIVPRALAYEVLVRAEEIVNNEQEIRHWIREGLSARQVVARGGYF